MDPDKLFGAFAHHGLRDTNDGGGGGGGNDKPEGSDGKDAEEQGGEQGDDKGKSDDEPKVPQAVLDKLAAKIRREERSKARKEAADQIALIGKAVGGKEDDGKGKEKTASKAGDDVAALREELRLEREFNESVSELTLTKDQRRKMFKAFTAEKPEDADDWVSDWVETFGIGAKATKEQGDGKEEKLKKKGKRDSDGGPTQTGDADAFLAGDPTKLTPAIYAQLVAKHGEQQANAKVREMVRNFAKAKQG